MFDKAKSRLTLKWAKKLKYINMIGGKCINCGCQDIRCLEFHHESDKENVISELLKVSNDEKIEKEIVKCKVMCARCHSIYHHSGIIGENKRRLNKKILLEFKGVDKCEKCGWSGHQSGFDFHHEGEKDFILSTDVNIRLNSVEDITNIIEEELNKCIVICRNCHRIEHSTKTFENIKAEIYKKEVKTYKKTDHNMVLDMFKKGMKLTSIAKELGVRKSLIHYIVNKK